MDTGENHQFINLDGQRVPINMPCAFYKSSFDTDGFTTDRYDLVNGIVLTITHKGDSDVVDSNFKITQLTDGSFAFTNIPNPTFQDLHA